MKNPLIEKKRVCLIVSGISGSGKSTFAEFLQHMIGHSWVEICTADDYHMVDGEYKFHIENLGKAHEWCQEKVDTSMVNEIPIVIVANTSTSQSERNVYRRIAEKYDYEVVELIMNGKFKDVHGVPENVLEGQKSKLINSLTHR